MAGVAGVNTALKMFMDAWKDHKSAKLSLKSENGELSVIVEVNFGQYNPNDGKF